MRMMVDEDDAHKNDEDDSKKVLHSSSSSSKHNIIYIDLILSEAFFFWLFPLNSTVMRVYDLFVYQ